jgi:DNA-binding response OmpR family regulator
VAKPPVLDPEGFEARLGNQSCFLGNTREFALLARLNRRPGRYVSYDHLRDDVWNDIETETNTIQRTVSNLRRKLRDAGLTSVEIDGRQKSHYRLGVVPTSDTVTSA